jgi:hypothetical protein
MLALFHRRTARMRLLPIALLLTAAGLLHAGEPARYGSPMAPGVAVPIAVALADFDAHSGKTARFSGRITQVCQAKGCWMVLEDEGRTARVMFGDHAFAIPKDSSGRAQVQGVLSRKQLTPAQVQHLREDARGLAVEPVEYRILADGVQIEPAPAG